MNWTSYRKPMINVLITGAKCVPDSAVVHRCFSWCGGLQLPADSGQYGNKSPQIHNVVELSYFPFRASRSMSYPQSTKTFTRAHTSCLWTLLHKIFIGYGCLAPATLILTPLYLIRAIVNHNRSKKSYDFDSNGHKITGTTWWNTYVHTVLGVGNQGNETPIIFSVAHGEVTLECQSVSHKACNTSTKFRLAHRGSNAPWAV